MPTISDFVELLKWVGKVGTTTVIGLYLVWFLTNNMDVNVRGINAALLAHVAQTEKVQQTVTQLLTDNTTNQRRTLEYMHQQLAVQLQTCINAAKSTYQVNKCIQQTTAGYGTLIESEKGSYESDVQ